MSAGQTILNLSILILGFAIIRPLTVVLHELGHAIPFILFTRSRTTIYVGSYGDPNGSLHFRLGLLEVWFKYNPLLWKQGLCVPSAKQISINRNIVCTLMGPAASFLLASAAIVPAFAYEVNDQVKFLLCMLFVSAILDLEQNLRYTDIPIRLYNGSDTHTDGYTLRQLLAFKKLGKDFERIENLFHEDKFKEVVHYVLSLQNPDKQPADIYRMAVYSAIRLNDFEQAIAFSSKLSQRYSLTADDYANYGAALLGKEDFPEAEKALQQCLSLDPVHQFSLFNLANTYIVLDKYNEAILVFDRLLAVKPHDSLAYSGRGLAKLKIGMKTEGFNDIYDALRIEPNNAYAYRNLGIFYLDQGEADQALKHLLKARDINPETYHIDQLIESAKLQTNQP